MAQDTTDRGGLEMARFVIDHERYGDRTEFASLADALAAIHACGDDFTSTELFESGSQILDERGDVVGEISEELDAD